MNRSTQPGNLCELFTSRAASDKILAVISSQDERELVSYAELYQCALQRLFSFQSKGVEAGEYLIIQSSSIRQFIEAFWACVLGGIVPVPVSAGNSKEQRLKLFRIAAKLKQPALFTDSANLNRIEQFAAESQLGQAFDALRARTQLADSNATDPNAAPLLADTQPEDVAFIQFSSGSTSSPKGIVLTHRNLIVNLNSIIQGSLISQADRMLSWMPLTHDMGLIGFHLTPVLADIDHCLMQTDLFVRRPALWLNEADQFGATILCSPNFGYQHLLKSFKSENHQTLDLSAVRLLFNGAEPISSSLCEQFMQRLQPFGLDKDAMYPVYGLAEASLAVSFPSLTNRFTTKTLKRDSLGIGHAVQPGESDQGAINFVAVGQPVPGVEVCLRNSDGQDLADGHVGHIHIRGENVTSGYLDEPDLNAQMIDSNAWLDTGDLGVLYDNQLYITGRFKDIIFVSGQNVYPHDLEELIIVNKLVERGKLAVSSLVSEDSAVEKLVVFVQHRKSIEELSTTARSITGLLGTEAGVAVHAVVPVPRIPKTTSGKVQRFVLVNGLQNGEYQPIIQSTAESVSMANPSMVETIANDKDLSAAPDRTDVSASENDSQQDHSTRDQLLSICNSQLEQIELGLDDNLFELGISSLTLAEIHGAIEQRWPDQLQITDLFDYPTVRQMAQFLDQ
ncbi:MAG: non-ribosomal peptide synthetase [Granulosicoccus sp.]|nr:non-ribosomal peptide synthetase [Granulosicoccus sp.]